MNKRILYTILGFALTLGGCSGGYELGDYYHAGGEKGIVLAVDDGGKVTMLMSVDEAHDLDSDSAMKWASNYADGSWHLPSKEEMAVIKKYKSLMNITIGHKKLQPVMAGHTFYWTSTPCSESHTFACGPDGIRCYFNTNTSPFYRARAVKTL